MNVTDNAFIFVSFTVAVVLVIAVMRRYAHWRNLRDLRIRDNQLRKFVMGPDLRGTKERIR